MVQVGQSGNIQKEIPDFAAFLQEQLQKQMAAGKISEPHLGLWLTCVDNAKA
jgi:hypothetical protein